MDPLRVRDSLIDLGQQSRDLQQVGNAWDIAGVRKVPPKLSANIPLKSPQISPQIPYLFVNGSSGWVHVVYP